MLGLLDHPERQARVIHIGGTSGKGTVCYLVDAMLRAHDKQTMLSVSPHIYDIRERIQSNGQPLPEKLYIQIVNTVIERARELTKLGTPLQYHAILTAITMLGFTSKRHDYTILEAGLGGPYDLTNQMVSSNKYCVLTQIGVDNMHLLGDTLEEIAANKTYILQPNTQLSMLAQEPGAQKIINAKVKELKITSNVIERSGAYELDDVRLALNTVENIANRDGWRFNQEVARSAVKSVYMPGRFEKRLLKEKLVILDGAHNPQSLIALADRLQRSDLTSLTVVFSLGVHKNVRQSLRALLPITKHLIVTDYFKSHKYPTRQAAEPYGVAQMANDLHFNEITVEPSPTRALQLATTHNETVLVTGSFYLVSEVDHVF